MAVFAMMALFWGLALCCYSLLSLGMKCRGRSPTRIYIIEYPLKRSKHIRKDQRNMLHHVASTWPTLYLTNWEVIEALELSSRLVPCRMLSWRGSWKVTFRTIRTASRAQGLNTYGDHWWWLVMIGDLTWGKADENRWSGEVLDPPQPSLRAKVFLPVFRQRQRLNN